MLIGITGAKGSGKDTLGDFFVGQGFTKLKFADPLKNMIRTLYQEAGVGANSIEQKIEGELKEKPCDVLLGQTPRHAMQTLGTEWRNMIDVTLWSSIMFERAAIVLGKGAPVVFTDVRFQHEADVIQELGGYLIRVDRPGTGEGDGHSSETEMHNLKVDYIISNILGIYHFESKGREVLNDITS